MIKNEVVEYILAEAEEYKRMAIVREERFGAVSVEALIQWGKYRALRKLARQLDDDSYKNGGAEEAVQ